MARTMVRASAIGTTEIRLFNFLVDKGATYVGLPKEDIEALGLPLLPGGRHKALTANGVVERDSYGAAKRLDGEIAHTVATESPIPIIGYNLLENLKLKVNPVTRSLERADDDEHMPPYALIKL